MRSLIRVLFAVVLGASILTACGSSKSTTSTQTPKQGGVLREGLVTLGSADPAKAQTVSERQMADQLYDGLTAWSPDNLDAVPAIASKWEASADQTHWTFHLRLDAKASNGDVVTATDVKRSLEHIARKSSGSVSTDTLSIISGFSDFTNNDQVASLLGIVVVDPATVRIDLSQPFADLPLLLGNPTFGIVHYGAGDVTYTTGPFMVSGTPAAAATQTTLIKAPGSAANLDSIVVNYYTDADTSYAAFVKGDVDWTPVGADKAADAGKAYGTNLFRTSLRTLYLSFNLNDAAVASAGFRQAVIQAIDRNAVATAIGPSAKSLDGVVPTGIPGHQGSGCGAPCVYDPDHAKTLLSQAFPAGGIPALTITAPTGDPLTDAASALVVSDLAAVGITATVNRLAPAAFDGFTVDPSRELFQTSWSAAYPSGGAFLQPLFAAGSESNVTGMNDSKTSSDINTAESTSGDAARLLNWSTVETDVLNQNAIVPLATFPVNSVEQSRVRGIAPLPTGNFDASRAWVTTPQP